MKSKTKLKKRCMENAKNNASGITLIALIITIIVLLILAGVSISALTGENGLLNKARDAKTVTDNSTTNENTTLTGYENEIDKYLGSLGQGGIVEREILQENKTINGEDSSTHNNPIIPKGFRAVDVGDAKWGDGTSAPTQEAVNAGLVIEDEQGNQFVWIAVDGGLYDGTLDTTKVQLGRYVFNSDGTINTASSQSMPEGQIKSYADYYYTEGKKDETTDNTHAKDIEGFISSVESNGGYYIARYEASKGANDKPLSKVSEGVTTENDATKVTEKMLWNNITQPDAATACRNMYDSNYGITSDLMNSYAWDTAIVFIQKNSGNDDYSVDQSGNIGTLILENTGETGDVVCNIFDMSGNVQEWTTETASDSSGGPCTSRGGSNGNSYSICSARYGTWDTADISIGASFRPILYL